MIGSLYEWKIGNDDWERSKTDFAVMDKGNLLSDQFWKAYFAFNDKKISTQEYVATLQHLEPQYEKHLEEIDNRIWKEDAISYRKGISDELGYIKRDIALYANK